MPYSHPLNGEIKKGRKKDREKKKKKHIINEDHMDSLTTTEH